MTEPCSDREGDGLIEDERARVERWARTFADALYRGALRLCGDADDAHDLVQDTFERALLRGQTCAPDTNERGWLFTILYNRFIDLTRKSSHEEQGRRRLLAMALAGDLDAADPPWRRITLEQLHAAIDQIEPPFSEACRMHVCEGHSYAEIAEKLRISINTVGTRLLRARGRLQTLLHEQLEAV